MDLKLCETLIRTAIHIRIHRIICLNPIHQQPYSWALWCCTHLPQTRGCSEWGGGVWFITASCSYHPAVNALCIHQLPCSFSYLLSLSIISPKFTVSWWLSVFSFLLIPHLSVLTLYIYCSTDLEGTMRLSNTHIVPLVQIQQNWLDTQKCDDRYNTFSRHITLFVVFQHSFCKLVEWFDFDSALLIVEGYIIKSKYLDFTAHFVPLNFPTSVLFQCTLSEWAKLDDFWRSNECCADAQILNYGFGQEFCK